MHVTGFTGFPYESEQNGDKVSKNNERCHICIQVNKTLFLLSHEKYRTLSIYNPEEKDGEIKAKEREREIKRERERERDKSERERDCEEIDLTPFLQYECDVIRL